MSTEEIKNKLDIALRLAFPVINLVTFETARAAMVVQENAKELKKRFIEVPFMFLPNRDKITSTVSSAQQQDKGPAAAEMNKNGCVFFDQYFFDRMRVNPETLPALKSSLEWMQAQGHNYVVCGRDSMPDEFVYHVDLPPMSQDEILELVKVCERYIEDSRDLFTGDERKTLANHCRGLSHTQMKNVLTMCAYRKLKGQDYLHEIRDEKAHIFKDVGLDILSPVPMSDVGGLENVKEFLAIRKAGWDQDLPVKGILCAGIPGGGKSLIAKAVAGVFGTSLVRFDVSRFYNKYIGETEKQFLRALQTVEQIAPVVLFIDEIEKVFGQSESEHETTRHLLGTFLTWLQERKGKVFVVATANRVNLLPPELVRAGRWDRTFFFDLPNRAERAKIAEIHLTKANASLEQFGMDMLVQLSDRYTGAEIEQAVSDARYLANARGEAISHADVVAALNAISPSSQTRREDIDRILRLKDQGFYPASKPDGEAEAPVATGRRVAV